MHWTAWPGNPVLDAYARCVPPVRGGKVHQIHDTVVWQYGDYYLALYHYQHSGDRLDIELAASRDGENFTFICPGQKVISLGGEGAWDADYVNPCVPLVDDDGIRLYYGGMSRHRWVNDNPEINYRRSAGLATLRLDGFTHLQLAPGRLTGSFTTIPIERAGGASSLHVNCVCAGDGYLTVEALDPDTGRMLPGYSRQECGRITGDSVAAPVRWRSRPDLSAITKEQFQLRFHFHGRGEAAVKLFSFGMD